MDDFFNSIGNLFKSGKTLEEEHMTFYEIIEKNKYPLELHNVITEDGFILSLFRIPSSQNSIIDNTSKQPILMQHGLFDSSDGWICNSPDKVLPFIFADMGYDVWLANSRGNKHSKRHKKYYTESFEFWSFSFYELGKYDLPANLDYISSKNTSGEKIIYFGHSQGTCLMFSALCTNLDYIKSKVKLFIAFAPVARVGGVDSHFLKIVQALKFDDLLKLTKTYEVFPEDRKASKFSTWVNFNFPSLTNGILDLISDKNSKLNNNKERLGVFFNHYPSGCSLKSIGHFVQMFRNDRFSYYDYGMEANLHIYGDSTPPDYTLENIKDFNIALFVGTEDRLSTLRDTRWLHEKISSNVVFYKEYKNMGHLTFLIPLDISWYEDIFILLKKYTN